MNHCECKNEGMVTISVDRYEQLIRAESDANQLKALIDHKYNNYQTLDRDDLKMLVTLFIGIKED